MKTTVELPDELLRAAKASAARQGISLEDVFTTALRHHLLRSEDVAPGEEAWRRVFGKANRQEVAAVDAVVAEDLERIDLESWR
jgi:plasmid stability protein